MPARRTSLPRTASRTIARRALTRRALVGGAVVGGAAVVLLSACSPAIRVPVAPHATNPRCADVVLDVPATVAGRSKVTTTSQATAAWGARDAAITLRCGVPAPGPSAQCQAIENPDGSSIDWISFETSTGWSFVTYGREPATEVDVPSALGGGQPTAALVDLADAIEDVPATSRCT